MNREWELWENFIVIEGLDGSGTTTQARFLEETFVDSGISVLRTAEPTSSFIGRAIRKILRGEERVEAGVLARLFAADRQNHLFGIDGIREALQRGEKVVCDRYHFSSLAYQSLSMSMEEVWKLNSGFPIPEHLFYLEVSAETAMKRLDGRSEKEIFENLKTQKRLVSAYDKALGLFADAPVQITKLDGSLAPEIIIQKIRQVVL